VAAGIDFDEIAASILLFEDAYRVEEWAEVEALADALVKEARLLGVEPREHAAERMVTMAASFAEDAPPADDDDVVRIDLAMAAALVWVGRIG
jgi:hypothetical protein